MFTTEVSEFHAYRAPLKAFKTLISQASDNQFLQPKEKNLLGQI